MTSPRIHTPRPAPVFMQPPLTFSTKKSRGQTPVNAVPPKPPIKSAPPVSRIFPKKELLKAQPVSFKSPEKAILSPHYNESNKELFFDQCFSLVSQIGVGSFGEVFKVQSKEDGRFYAIKRSRQKFRGESDRHRKLAEVAKHESLPEHVNCVRFVKAWEEKQHLYIQTELCKTSLNTLAEENHSIPERVIWNYMVDLLLAVRHLHDHDLVHMDIKPENIFVSFNNVCKLGDFGLVIDLTKDIEMSDALEGDPKYLAPELMSSQFGKPADIFSLGITILELASDLDLPRGGDLWHQLRSGHLPEEFLIGVSRELKEIIRLMMEPNPISRPTVHQLLEHDYIAKVKVERLNEIANHEDEKAIILSGTPPHAFLQFHKHPPEWDHSFSDDDILDHAGCTSLSNNSMGVPLLDTSSGSDDSFRQRSASGSTGTSCTFALPSARRKNPSSPGRIAASSGSASRHSTSECGLFEPAGTFYSSSPVSGMSSSYASADLSKFVTSPVGPPTTADQPCLIGVVRDLPVPSAAAAGGNTNTVSPEVHSHTVEPRNLLKVFEHTLSDDDLDISDVNHD